MRALAVTLALFSGSVAFASSELQLASSSPISLIVDGENQGPVQPLEPTVIDIEPGVHRIQLRGMMGKDLYDRELIFDDNTRTELQWQRKELRLGQVVKLDPNRAPDEEDMPVEAPEDEEPPVAEPPEVEELAIPETPEEVEAPDEVEAPPEPERSRRSKTPAKTAPPPPKAAPKTRPAARDARSGSVVVEATEGLDLQISHGGQLLRVTVDDGELVITDPNGTEIRFPAQNDAW